MKNLIILLFVAVTASLTTIAHAQNDTAIPKWQTKTGFIFAPQGVVIIEQVSQLFTVKVPLNIGISFTDGKNTVNVLYNLTFNAGQVVYARSFQDFGFYMMANKSVVVKNAGYGCFAFTKKVADGKELAFCEFGSTTDRWNPQMHLGVIIPLMMDVKNKKTELD